MAYYKAHVEASICETYIVEFFLIFISYYFEPHLRMRVSHISRLDDGGEVPSCENLSIFSHPRWPLLKNTVRGDILDKNQIKKCTLLYAI